MKRYQKSVRKHHRTRESLSASQPVYWISPEVFAAKAKSQNLTLTDVFAKDPAHEETKEMKPRPRHEQRQKAKEQRPRKSALGNPKLKRKCKDNTGSSGLPQGKILGPEGAAARRKQIEPTRLTEILSNDPYNVLELSPAASRCEIKRAFMRKVVGTHPDKGGSTEDFIRVKTAYEILVDKKYPLC